MVRLAPAGKGRNHQRPGNFQSQLGSIGALVGPVSADQLPDFQSQLGSIGADHQAPGPPGALALSIPAWFDWRPTHKGHAYEATQVFQSQLGSIGAHVSLSGRLDQLRLSIPAWFDWRPESLSLHPFSPPSFQSQLGSIGARVAAGVAVISVRFQSQLGSIGAIR